jgi:hypothetical protein
VLTIIYIILVCLVGWLSVSLSSKDLSREEHLGLAFIVGSGIHSLIYFITSVLTDLINPNNIFTLGIELTILIVLTRLFRINYKHWHNIKIRKNRGDIIVLILGISIIIFTIIQTLYWPIYEPDAIHLYDFRALRLLEGDKSKLLASTSINHNELYPPFTSLMHLFFYQTGISNPKIFYGIIFASFFLTLIGYVLRLTNSRTKAYLTAALTIFTPSVLWNSFLALPNVSYMIFFSLSILYFHDYNLQKKAIPRMIILPAILIGLTTWTRSEPFWVIPSLILLSTFALRKNFKAIIIAILIFLSISSVWPNSVKTETVTSQITDHISYATILVKNTYSFNEAAKFMIKPLVDCWGLVLPLFIGVFIFGLIKKKAPSLLEITASCISISIIIGFLVFSYLYSQWTDLGSSLYRLAIMVIPLYWVAIFTSHVWNKDGVK